MRRVFCTVLVVAALAFSAGAAGAQEATVESIVAATSISFPDHDGTCTGVPDRIPGIFDFTDACASHDECYASGEQTRAQCDEAFRSDMVVACVVQHPSALDPARYACLTFAQLYYAGIRFFGQFFF